MHMKAIFAKMNIINRTEAVANATRRGLIQL
jgi:DNA-binding CsgD family transcriptional regulator